MTGSPFRSLGSIFSLFSATTLPVAISLALATQPYAPSSMSLSLSYFSTLFDLLKPPPAWNRRSRGTALLLLPLPSPLACCSEDRSGVSLRLLAGRPSWLSSSPWAVAAAACRLFSSSARRAASAFSLFSLFFSSFSFLALASRAASSSLSAQRDLPFPDIVKSKQHEDECKNRGATARD